MSSPVAIDLFVEDRAHEEFLRPLIRRMARENGSAADVRVRAARGGHPRVLEELGKYQKAVEHGIAGLSTPDILVVATDSNCHPVAATKSKIRKRLSPGLRSRTVVACPDPHIELWYLADPEAFHQVVGVTPAVKKQKCEHGYYKSVLADAVVRAGHPATLGGIEFAPDIVDTLDLYRAAKADNSLKNFLRDLLAQLKRTALQ